MSGRAISRRSALVTTVGFVLAPAAAGAQEGAANFPDHPIRVIVSVPAGGGVDVVARIVAAKMRAFLGQPLAVENKAGAGGSLAADAVFHAEPDGYTLLASQPAPITTNALLYKSLDYDPAQLTPIAILSHVANVLLVREDFPAKSVQQLIAYAKANPGKLNYASQGIGTTSHLTAALFAKIAKVQLVHVPYKGTAPALNDLIAGHVDLMFSEIATSLPLLPGRQSQNSRGSDEGTSRRDCGYSDAGGSRRAGLHFRHLASAQRAAENAARHRRQAQRRGQQGAEGCGIARPFPQAQPATRRRHAGADERVPQGGDAKVGRCDPRRRNSAALIAGYSPLPAARGEVVRAKRGG